MTARRPAPKPWPMKWVVLAIAVFIGAYTFVNLRFRKIEPSHEPAAEMRQRVTAARLKDAGWEKFPGTLRRPTEPASGDFSPVSFGAIGFGLDLDDLFVEKPMLPAALAQVKAPASVARGAAYEIHFTATIPDQHYQVGDLDVYRRGREFVIVPTLEPLPAGELLSRWKENDYTVSLPTVSLEPGNYRVRLLCAGPAATWPAAVR